MPETARATCLGTTRAGLERLDRECMPLIEPRCRFRFKPWRKTILQQAATVDGAPPERREGEKQYLDVLWQQYHAMLRRTSRCEESVKWREGRESHADAT